MEDQGDVRKGPSIMDGVSSPRDLQLDNKEGKGTEI